MNYRYAQNLKKITCEEFVPLFDQQYPLKWTDVQVRDDRKEFFLITVKLRFRRRSSRCYGKSSNGQRFNNPRAACQPAIDLERSTLLI